MRQDIKYTGNEMKNGTDFYVNRGCIQFRPIANVRGPQLSRGPPSLLQDKNKEHTELKNYHEQLSATLLIA